MTDFADTDLAHLELRALAAWQQDMIDKITNQNVQIVAKDKPLVVGIDPASPAGDRTATTMVIAGHGAQFFIVDDFDLFTSDRQSIDNERRWLPFGEQTITGEMTAYFEDEALLKMLKGETKKAQPGEFKPDNRKQRRIDAAKERQKPRGQRKKLIMDIETYDPNRTKDWLR